MSVFLENLIVLSIAATASNAADKNETSSPKYISTLCTLAGDWEGKFERFKENKVYRNWAAKLDYACLPDDSVFSESRSLIKKEGANSYSHKVLFPRKSGSEMHISYFRPGRVGTYFFKAVNINYRDDKHWTLIREASHKVALSNPNAPVSRYTHARNGDELIISREVKKDHSSSEWRLSSKITLSKVGRQ